MDEYDLYTVNEQAFYRLYITSGFIRVCIGYRHDSLNWYNFIIK